jgi:nitrogen fixation/metabolism regulation signal transduction histidine kinase
VHIAANTLPDRVEVEITDDGRGIPADERARVFDRFVRLGASRERAGGSGGDHTGRITITDAPSGAPASSSACRKRRPKRGNPPGTAVAPPTSRALREPRER